jgi:hypothetical protein
MLRSPYSPSAYDDDLEDQPSQGWFHQWVLGCLVPLLLAIHGLRAVVLQYAETHGRDTMTLVGKNAIAYGIAVVAIALFMHCHYFWGNLYDQIWFAVLGKIIAATTMIAALAYLIVRIGIFGSN